VASRLFLVLLFAALIFPQTVLADLASRRTPVVVALEKVGPAVVNIRTEQIVARRSSPFFGFGGSLFEDFFGEFGPSRVYASQSLGSGVLVDKRGYVLTNAHVIEKASKIFVALPEQLKEQQAELVGVDTQLDLAVLKLDSRRSYPAITLGDSDDLMLGETVIAVGNPLGLGHSITTGVVSTAHRRLPSEDGSLAVFVQSDALINPGNSGGPLLNLDGELVGINTAIARQAQGIGFAIPVAVVRRVLDDLIRFGEVRPGFIGVIPGEVGRAFTRARGGGGVLVTDLDKVSPAAAGGLHVADVIVSLDGVPVDTVREYLTLLATYPPQSRVSIGYLRGTSEKEAVIATLAVPDGYAQSYALKVFGFWPADTTEGVRVGNVEPGGAAEQAGLRTGDRIVEVGGVAIENLDVFTRLLEKNLGVYPLNFLLVRRNKGYYVDLP